jgi:hypothetical protein
MPVTIANLPWGNRTPDLFIDAMVKSAKVLERFRLVDNVKSKAQVPVFSAALTFGSDLCVFDPQSTAGINEKEMTVDTYKWAFLNCKSALETSYRSVLLKQGQHNEETMDAQFKDWVFEYFAKLSAQKALEVAATKLTTEMNGDGTVLDYDTNIAAFDENNILTHMEGAYKKMSATMLASVYGDADRAYKPAFFLSTAAMQAYQIAIADKYTTTPEGLINGTIPAYFGMEVIHFASLPAAEFFVSAPDNIVMLTDDYNDVRAIDMKYESELSSDKIWGQFKLGFSYLKGYEIVYAKNHA